MPKWAKCIDKAYKSVSIVQRAMNNKNEIYLTNTYIYTYIYYVCLWLGKDVAKSLMCAP